MTILSRAARWEESDTVAPDTNWFSSDITGKKGIPVKHTIQLMVPASTIVNLQIANANAASDKEYILNNGTALTAGAGYQFGFIVRPGTTYNIQHKTGTQNVSCEIFSSDNLDL